MTRARRLVLAGLGIPLGEVRGDRLRDILETGRQTAPARVGGPLPDFHELASVGRAAIRASNWRADCAADFDGVGDVLCEPGEQLTGSTAASYPHLAGPATNDELPPMLSFSAGDTALKEIQELPHLAAPISQDFLPAMNINTVNSLPAWSEEPSSEEDSPSEASVESDPEAGV